MTRILRRAGLVTALTLAVLTPAAQAETFKATFGPGQANVFDWEGMSTGVASIPAVIRNGCGDFDPIFRCDRVIYKMEAAGTLEVSVAIDNAVEIPDPSGVTGGIGYPDLDLYLYKSNAAGEYAEDAEPVAEAATGAAVETFSYNAQPGYYVLEVEPYQGQDITYKGSSKGSGFPEVAPVVPAQTTTPTTPTTPATAPAQQQQQTGSGTTQSQPKKTTGKRAKCVKKAKKIKNKGKRKKALKRCSKLPK